MPSQKSTSKDEVLLYQTDDGKTRIDVHLQGETVWLTQTQMTELFQTTKQNISLHLKNVFDEGELVKDSVVKESLTTASDGKKYNTAYYNLDVVISVKIWRCQTPSFFLEDVIVYKKAFFNASYANYDLCLNGQFRLVPKDDEIENLKNDYIEMQNAGMFSQKPQPFDELIGVLKKLELEINSQ